MQTERTYPVLSRVLIAVGLVFLGISAFGNWRFGLSLSADPVDRYWLAVIYAGADVAAGVLVATGATMLRHPAWSWKCGGLLALLPAIILVAFSILSTFGLMSGRIATLAGQKAAVSSDQGRLKWLRGQTINYDLSKTERQAFRAEEREAAKQARAAASVITDGQAASVAEAFGSTPEKVQRWLTIASATIPLSVKFACLGFGFFLYGARTSAKAGEDSATKKTQGGSDGSSGGSGGGEPKKPTLVHPEPKPEPAKIRAEPSKQRSVFYVPATGAPERLSAFDRAYELAMQNPHLSTRALVKEAGKQFSQSTAHRVKKRLSNKVHSTVRKFGNGRSYQTPAYN